MVARVDIFDEVLLYTFKNKLSAKKKKNYLKYLICNSVKEYESVAICTLLGIKLEKFTEKFPCHLVCEFLDPIQVLVSVD